MMHNVSTTSLFVVLSLLGMMMIRITTAFTPASQFYQLRNDARGTNTRIFLEDWVAEMIDGELYRQNHHKEYEEKWMKKNKGAVLSQLSDDSVVAGGSSSYPTTLMLDENQREEYAEHKRDERMAFTKPEQYCADRCIATGNCDIYQDFYELSPQDVLNFCEECVLNDTDDSTCDVPDAFYEKEPPLRP